MRENDLLTRFVHDSEEVWNAPQVCDIALNVAAQVWEERRYSGSDYELNQDQPRGTCLKDGMEATFASTCIFLKNEHGCANSALFIAFIVSGYESKAGNDNLTRAVDKRSNRTLFRRSQIAQVLTARTANGI